MSSIKDVIAYVNNWENQLVKNVQVLYKQAKRNTWNEYWDNYEKVLNRVFKESIDEFYNDYSPEYYNRDHSLYKLLETEMVIGGDGLFDGVRYGYEPGNMTTFRESPNGADGSGLYDQVFRKGWHGGADKDNKWGRHPHEGTPYWRTPVPYVRILKNGERRNGRAYIRWGREAEVARISPLENINRRMDEYEAREMQRDFNAIKAKHMKEDFYDVISRW